MQKVALRAQLGRVERERQQLELRVRSLSLQLAEVRERLDMARAGLLVALPHVAEERVRLLVGVALAESEIPRNFW